MTMITTTNSPAASRHDEDPEGPAHQRFLLNWQEAAANHERLLARNAAQRRFGHDPEAGVQFVVEKALPLSGRVLDVGTGKGRFVTALAQHLPAITTVDISAEEQHYARLEAAFLHIVGQIDFVVADASQLPWEAASFDGVVSMNAFHHFTEPCRVFSEMLRVLRPGGKLVLADFSPAGFQLMDALHQAEGKTHPHPPGHFAQWQTALQMAGFAVQSFEGQHQEVLVAVKSEINR